jgi:hypothetical protein
MASVRRVGWLTLWTENDPQQERRKALRDGLAKLGWFEDRNLRIDVRLTTGDRHSSDPLSAVTLLWPSLGNRLPVHAVVICGWPRRHISVVAGARWAGRAMRAPGIRSIPPNRKARPECNHRGKRLRRAADWRGSPMSAYRLPIAAFRAQGRLRQLSAMSGLMQRNMEVGVRPHRNDWLVVRNSRIMKRRKSGYVATTFL